MLPNGLSYVTLLSRDITILLPITIMPQEHFFLRLLILIIALFRCVNRTYKRKC